MSSAIRNFVVTLIASLLIFSAISYTIISNVSSIFPDISTPETLPPDEKGDDGVLTDSQDVHDSPVKASDDSFTFVLIGTDYQPDVLHDYDVSAMNAEREGFRIKAREIHCDAILIVRADRQKQTYMFSSIPSNLAVTVDGNDVALGRVYGMKGIDYFLSAIYAATGLKIDYYAMATISQFENIIDTIGGIDFTVPTSMSYIDESQELEIDIVRGAQKLDGNKASDMLRYVSYGDGDVSRRRLTLDFAKELMKKLTSPENAGNAISLFNSIYGTIATNFSLADLTQRLEIILDYPTFTSTELTYPASLKGDGLYEGNLDRALEIYKDYR